MNTQAPLRERQAADTEARKDLACGLFGQRINRQSDQNEAAEPVPA